ncbi:MAG: hypothetical protein ACREU1_09550 [Burkholderiales bacterium]
MGAADIVRAFLFYLGVPSAIALFAASLYQIFKTRLEIEGLKRKAAEHALADARIVKVTPEEIQKYGKAGNFWNHRQEEREKHSSGRRVYHGGTFLISAHFVELLPWLKSFQVIERMPIPAGVARGLQTANRLFVMGGVLASILIATWVDITFELPRASGPIDFGPRPFILMGVVVVTLITCNLVAAALDGKIAKHVQGRHANSPPSSAGRA